ncbi:cytochrome c oxidase subunit II [Nocardioides caldifontis]|uniref:aa3-type cytochrome oxidase subunit II n=1 Tax=Nocardioides caldifontis TaxID=2588938 RepID=UPI003B8453A0
MWALVAPAVLALSACSDEAQGEWSRIAMPEGASDRSEHIIDFWQWTWLAAILVGILTWGLILYAAFKFRRRSDDEVPVQTRYNLPMEILYTIAPVIVVLVFFKFVIDTQNEVDAASDQPDHVVKVVGQQWSWTFNYVDDPALGGSSEQDVCEDQTDAESATCVYNVGTPAEVPTMYLPVDETVRFELVSPDVVHSFWVPAFNYKLDVIPGRENAFEITPTREGTFVGRCAELCGTYHSRMLFNVEIVSAEEYEQHLRDLADAGNVGIALGGSEAITQDGLDAEEETEAGE